MKMPQQHKEKYITSQSRIEKVTFIAFYTSLIYFFFTWGANLHDPLLFIFKSQSLTFGYSAICLSTIYELNWVRKH